MLLAFKFLAFMAEERIHILILVFFSIYTCHFFILPPKSGFFPASCMGKLGLEIFNQEDLN